MSYISHVKFNVDRDFCKYIHIMFTHTRTHTHVHALLDFNDVLQIFLIYLQIFLIHLVIIINRFKILSEFYFRNIPQFMLLY